MEIADFILQGFVVDTHPLKLIFIIVLSHKYILILGAVNMKKNIKKRRNNAFALSNKLFRKRVKPSKKLYKRKEKHHGKEDRDSA